MKMFKRLSILALVAVVVCMFSVSAFAANVFSDTVNYENDVSLYVRADIDRYSTSGEINHLTTDLVDNYSGISVTYSYYLNAQGTKVTFSDYETARGVDYCSITKVINQDCFAMIFATYTFEAQISPYLGYYSYGPVTAKVEY